MEAIHDSAVERRRDNLIYALSGTAWPYCLSMSAALPENMRGLALSAMVIKLASRGQTGRVLAALWQYAWVATLQRSLRRVGAARGAATKIM